MRRRIFSAAAAVALTLILLYAFGGMENGRFEQGSTTEILGPDGSGSPEDDNGNSSGRHAKTRSPGINVSKDRTHGAGGTDPAREQENSERGRNLAGNGTENEGSDTEESLFGSDNSGAGEERPERTDIADSVDEWASGEYSGEFEAYGTGEIPVEIEDATFPAEDTTFPAENTTFEADPEPEQPVLEYLGDWTITAYCPCAKCCGNETGMTSSEVPAVSGHTVACNSLPAGTRVMIEGIIYTIEDTGSTPYGDDWIDIFFDTHEEAMAYGVQILSVYLVVDE